MAKTDNNFTTFLESMNDAEAQNVPGIDPIAVSAVLKQIGGMSVQELQQRVHLDKATLAQTLATMRNLDLIVVGGEPGHEEVDLTAMGKQVTDSVG